MATGTGEAVPMISESFSAKTRYILLQLKSNLTSYTVFVNLSVYFK